MNTQNNRNNNLNTILNRESNNSANSANSGNNGNNGNSGNNGNIGNSVNIGNSAKSNNKPNNKVNNKSNERGVLNDNAQMYNIPMSNRQKIFAKTLKDVLVCQDATQVFMVLATHCQDVNLTIPAIHRAMEMNKVCGLFKLYIINNSPNLLATVALTELSLKVFQDSLYKLDSLQDANNCKKVIRKNIEVNKNLLNSIKIMRNHLK
jgi:hypothetical protein